MSLFKPRQPIEVVRERQTEIKELLDGALAGFAYVEEQFLQVLSEWAIAPLRSENTGSRLKLVIYTFAHTSKCRIDIVP